MCTACPCEQLSPKSRATLSLEGVPGAQLLHKAQLSRDLKTQLVSLVFPRSVFSLCLLPDSHGEAKAN